MGDFDGVGKTVYRRRKACIRSDINLSVPESSRVLVWTRHEQQWNCRFLAELVVG
jgi:hypothetical protein